MADRNMKADMNVQFTEASSRQSIESGESVKTLFGKIRKWLSDLKPVAFSGSYDDLSNKPTTGVSGVKGNSETSYRTGNVNLTPANVGLGNVNNTSDANKPISTATQAALNGKVNKSGDTMTGQLITSFNCVANGSLEISESYFLTEFVDVIRYSSGGTGSIYIYQSTFNDITIPAGWYNFEWLPHRTGGKNGNVNRDNCSYGTLILTGMTVSNKAYIVRYNNSTIAEIHELYKGEELEAQVNYNTNNGVKNLLYTAPINRTSYGVTISRTSPNKYSISGTTTLINSTALLISNLSTGAIIGDDTQYPASGEYAPGDYIVSVNGIPAGINVQIIAATSVPISDSSSNYRVLVVNSSNTTQRFTLAENEKYLWSRITFRVTAATTYNNDEFEIMLRSATIEDSTFEPYAKSNSELTAKTNAALKQTGYNLLQITSNTQTINGVTFTVDKEAGTITANGTATAQIAYVINSNVGLSLDYEGKLWSDGSPLGSAQNTYFLNYEDANGKNINCYTNEPILPQNTSYPTTITRALIYIRQGQTVSNLVFKPMIVPAELAGLPFQPYAKSNAELTQEKLDKTGGTLPVTGAPDYKSVVYRWMNNRYILDFSDAGLTIIDGDSEAILQIGDTTKGSGIWINVVDFDAFIDDDGIHIGADNHPFISTGDHGYMGAIKTPDGSEITFRNDGIYKNLVKVLSY